MIKFTAHNGNTGINKFLPITRENVYRVRRLVRVYARKGYHVHACMNYAGRLRSNVFGSDQYTIATKREKDRAARLIVLDHIYACDDEIDQAIKYRDKYCLRHLQSEHAALWRVLIKVDRAAAMRYRDRADVIDRARRMHELIK